MSLSLSGVLPAIPGGGSFARKSPSSNQSAPEINASVLATLDTGSLRAEARAGAGELRSRVTERVATGDGIDILNVLDTVPTAEAKGQAMIESARLRIATVALEPASALELQSDLSADVAKLSATSQGREFATDTTLNGTALFHDLQQSGGLGNWKSEANQMALDIAGGYLVTLRMRQQLEQQTDSFEGQTLTSIMRL